MNRTETRMERYTKKLALAKSYQFSLCTTYFSVPGNVAYVARTSACFGYKDMHIIGKLPPYHEMTRLSGGMSRLVNTIVHESPYKFIDYCRENSIKIVSAELTDDAIDLVEYKWDFNNKIVVCVGSEMDGVPTDILVNSVDKIKIDMPGAGYCLNCSQTANIIAYDYTSKYTISQK